MTGQWPPDAFVLLGAAIAILASIGASVVRDPLDRLHLLAPVTSLAGPLIGLGLALRDGVTLAAGVVVVCVAILAVAGAVLVSATARAIREAEREPADDAANGAPRR